MLSSDLRIKTTVKPEFELSFNGISANQLLNAGEISKFNKIKPSLNEEEVNYLLNKFTLNQLYGY